jgi:hypothetical protein
MEKKTLQVQPSFYTNSPYAKYIIKELEDDSYGLVFNEFLHEMGSMLEVDVIYNQINKSQWIHADNRHMQIILNKTDNNTEQFEFIPKTSKGEKLIAKMSEKLLKENKDYLDFQ